MNVDLSSLAVASREWRRLPRRSVLFVEHDARSAQSAAVSAAVRLAVRVVHDAVEAEEDQLLLSRRLEVEQRFRIARRLIVARARHVDGVARHLAINAQR